MQRWRVVAITAGLVVVGAVTGAAVGVLVAILSLPFDAASIFGVAALLVSGAGVGGVMGMVLAPATAWLFLRHVPIGRAIAQTALGTVLGALIGLLTGGPSASVILAFTGFGTVALWLRHPHVGEATSRSIDRSSVS